MNVPFLAREGLDKHGKVFAISEGHLSRHTGLSKEIPLVFGPGEFQLVSEPAKTAITLARAGPI